MLEFAYVVTFQQNHLFAVRVGHSRFSHLNNRLVVSLHSNFDNVVDGVEWFAKYGPCLSNVSYVELQGASTSKTTSQIPSSNRYYPGIFTSLGASMTKEEKSVRLSHDGPSFK